MVEESKVEIVKEIQPSVLEVETKFKAEESKKEVKNNSVEEKVEEIDEKTLEKTIEKTVQDIVEKAKIEEYAKEKITPLTVDYSEVVSGFEEARCEIKKLYEAVFNNPAFKPTLNDAVADLLAYIGGKAEAYNKGEDYFKAFGVDSSKFSIKYREVSYVPLAFKISVWADKNRGLSSTIEILNGLLRSLFALSVSNSESETVEIVKSHIGGVVDFLEKSGIDTGFN
ncbi:MAG: hypothetical protein J6Q38_00810 [Clostridia bacterium]|nr:hypothetical protein [Clostridia bacterium]